MALDCSSESGVTFFKLYWLRIFWSVLQHTFEYTRNSKTCLKRPLKKKTKIGLQDRLSLYAGQKYCRMLQESILQDLH